MDLELKKLLVKKPIPFIGVDEVGRGCLAGPVCAGAVVLNENYSHLERYSDSKVLTREKRTVLALQIRERHQIGIGYATVEEIDRMNILQASLLACKRAVLNLDLSQGTILIDGQYTISHFHKFSQVPIVKGDSRVKVISAASIVAKHFRDQWLEDLSKEYPGYGLEQNRGYPTVSHRKAIQNLGPSLIHRKSFSGVKEYL